MVRRKGELSRARIDSDWPHQIALPIEAAGGRNTIVIQRFCHDVSICSRHKSYRIDGQEFIVHCFATRRDARVLPDVLRWRVRGPDQVMAKRR
jgi:hypothetical protein